MGVSDEEWEDGPLPEGEPGARVRQGMSNFVWVSGVWRCGPGAAYAPGEDIGLWRWLQKPGELEELREREAQYIENYRYMSDRHASLETIVGEVQQALAGKPAGECVTDAGRAVAAVRRAVLDCAESETRDEADDMCDEAAKVLPAIAALCTKNGWTRG